MQVLPTYTEMFTKRSCVFETSIAQTLRLNELNRKDSGMSWERKASGWSSFLIAGPNHPTTLRKWGPSASPSRSSSIGLTLYRLLSFLLSFYRSLFLFLSLQKIKLNKSTWFFIYIYIYIYTHTHTHTHTHIYIYIYGDVGVGSSNWKVLVWSWNRLAWIEGLGNGK